MPAPVRVAESPERAVRALEHLALECRTVDEAVAFLRDAKDLDGRDVLVALFSVLSPREGYNLLADPEKLLGDLGRDSADGLKLAYALRHMEFDPARPCTKYVLDWLGKAVGKPNPLGGAAPGSSRRSKEAGLFPCTEEASARDAVYQAILQDYLGQNLSEADLRDKVLLEKVRSYESRAGGEGQEQEVGQGPDSLDALLHPVTILEGVPASFPEFYSAYMAIHASGGTPFDFTGDTAQAVVWYANRGDIKVLAEQYDRLIGRINEPCPGLFPLFMKYVTRKSSRDAFPSLAAFFSTPELITLAKKLSPKSWDTLSVRTLYREIVARLGSLEPEEFSAGVPQQRAGEAGRPARDLSIDACVRWLLALEQLSYIPTSYKAVARYYALLLDYQYNARASLSEFKALITHYKPDFLSFLYSEKHADRTLLDCDDAMSTIERMDSACPFFSRAFLPEFSREQVHAYLRYACATAAYSEILEREYSHDIAVGSVSEAFTPQAGDESALALTSIEARVDAPGASLSDPAVERAARKFWSSLSSTLSWLSDVICAHLFLHALVSRLNFSPDAVRLLLADLCPAFGNGDGETGPASGTSRRAMRSRSGDDPENYSGPAKPTLYSKNTVLPMGSDAFCTLFYDRESTAQAIKVEIWELNSRQLAESEVSFVAREGSSAPSLDGILAKIATDVPSLKGNTLTLTSACLSGALPLRVRPDCSSAVLFLRATVGEISHSRMFVIGAPSVTSAVTPLGLECFVLDGVFGHGLATSGFRTQVSSGDNVYSLSPTSSFTLPFHAKLSESQTEKLLIRITTAKLQSEPRAGLEAVPRTNPASGSSVPDPVSVLCVPVRCHQTFYAFSEVVVPRDKLQFEFEFSVPPASILPTQSGDYRETAISGVIPVTAALRATLYNVQTNFQRPLDRISHGSIQVRFHGVSGQLLSQVTVTGQEFREAIQTGRLNLLVPVACNEISASCEVTVKTDGRGRDSELTFSERALASNLLVPSREVRPLDEAVSFLPTMRVFADLVTHEGSSYLAVHFTDMNNAPRSLPRVTFRLHPRSSLRPLEYKADVGVSGLVLVPLAVASWALTLEVVVPWDVSSTVFSLPFFQRAQNGFLVAAPSTLAKSTVVIPAGVPFELDGYVPSQDIGFLSNVTLDLVDERRRTLTHLGGTSQALLAESGLAAASGPWAPLALPALPPGEYRLRFWGSGAGRTVTVLAVPPARVLKSVSALRAEFSPEAPAGEGAAPAAGDQAPDFLSFGLMRGIAYRFSLPQLLLRTGPRQTPEGLEMGVELFDSDISVMLERGLPYLASDGYGLQAHNPKYALWEARGDRCLRRSSDFFMGTAVQSEEEAYLKRRRNLMYGSPDSAAGETLSRAGCSLVRPGLTLFPVTVDTTVTDAVAMEAGRTVATASSGAAGARAYGGRFGGPRTSGTGGAPRASAAQCFSSVQGGGDCMVRRGPGLENLLSGGVSRFVPFSEAFSLAVGDGSSKVSPMRLKLTQAKACSQITLTMTPNDASYSLSVTAVLPWPLADCAAAHGLPSDKLSLPKRQAEKSWGALLPALPRGLSAPDFATLCERAMRALAAGESAQSVKEQLVATGDVSWTSPAAGAPVFIHRSEGEAQRALTATAERGSDEVYVYTPKAESVPSPAEFCVSGPASLNEYLSGTGAAITGRHAAVRDFILGFDGRSEEENLDLYLGGSAAPADGGDAQANPSEHRRALFSHEANLFLALQKPDFFRAHGLPLLLARLRKDIVDTWLCYFALPASRGATQSQVGSASQEAPAPICQDVEALYRPEINGLERALLADMFLVCFGEERAEALISPVAASKRDLVHPERERLVSAIRGFLRSRRAREEVRAEGQRERPEADGGARGAARNGMPGPMAPMAPAPVPARAPRPVPPREPMFDDAGAEGGADIPAGARLRGAGGMSNQKFRSMMRVGQAVQHTSLQVAPQVGYTRAEETKLYLESYYLDRTGAPAPPFSWSGFWSDFARYLFIRLTGGEREKTLAFSSALMHLCRSASSAELVLALGALGRADVRFSLQRPEAECACLKVLTAARDASQPEEPPEIVLLQTLCDRRTGLAVKRVAAGETYDLKTLVFAMADKPITASLRVRILLPEGCYARDYAKDYQLTLDIDGQTVATRSCMHTVCVLDPGAYKPGAAAVFLNGQRLAAAECSPVSTTYQTVKKVLAAVEVVRWSEICRLNDPEFYLLYLTMSPSCNCAKVTEELQRPGSGLSRAFCQDTSFALAVLSALQRRGASGLAWKHTLLATLSGALGSLSAVAGDASSLGSFVAATRPLQKPKKYDWGVGEVVGLLLGLAGSGASGSPGSPEGHEGGPEPAMRAVLKDLGISARGLGLLLGLVRFCLSALSGVLAVGIASDSVWKVPVAVPLPGGELGVVPAAPLYRQAHLDFTPFVIDRALSFAYKNILSNPKILDAYCNLLYDVSVLRSDREWLWGAEGPGAEPVPRPPVRHALEEDVALAYYLCLQNRYSEAAARLCLHDAELLASEELLGRVAAELQLEGRGPRPALDELEAFLQPRAQAVCLYAYVSVCTAETGADVKFVREVLALRPSFIETQPQSLRSYLFALQSYFEALVREHPDAAPAAFRGAEGSGLEGSRARAALQEQDQTAEQRAALVGVLGAATETNIAVTIDQKASTVTCAARLSTDALLGLKPDAEGRVPGGAVSGQLRAYRFSPEYLICQKVDISLLTSTLPAHEERVELSQGAGPDAALFSGTVTLPASCLPCYVEFEYQGRVERGRVDVPGVAVICDTTVGLLTAYESPEGRSAPAARAYIRVMAELKSGEYVFWKDGYTDLAGEFDYCTISALDVRGVKNFVIYAETQAGLAVIEEGVAPPARVTL